MSLEQLKRGGYSRHRQASAGAAITLVCGCGEYVALFECAKRISTVLGTRDLEDLGDGLMESIPRYRIRFEDIVTALRKLTTQYSVALVDMGADERFVLIWRLNSKAAEPAAVERELTIDDI
jgi:hypothetical protein